MACTLGENIEDLPIVNARSDKSLRVVPLSDGSVQYYQGFKLLDIFVRQNPIGQGWLELPASGDEVTNVRPCHRSRAPTLAGLGCHKPSGSKGCKCHPNTRAAQAIVRFDLGFREDRTRLDLTGQQSVP